MSQPEAPAPSWAARTPDEEATDKEPKQAAASTSQPEALAQQAQAQEVSTTQPDAPATSEPAAQKQEEPMQASTSQPAAPAQQRVAAPAAKSAKAAKGQQWHIAAGAPEKVPGGLPDPPQDRGCYVYMPSICDNAHVKPQNWKKVKQRKEARDKQKSCSMHKDFYDLWCGANDAIMAWVPGSEEKAAPAASLVATRPAAPADPGCYIFYPSGCPKGSGLDPQTQWLHYHNSMEPERAMDEGKCQYVRVKQNGFCGTSDIETVYVQ